jgi:hypothetical protein
MRGARTQPLIFSTRTAPHLVAGVSLPRIPPLAPSFPSAPLRVRGDLSPSR